MIELRGVSKASVSQLRIYFSSHHASQACQMCAKLFITIQNLGTHTPSHHACARLLLPSLVSVGKVVTWSTITKVNTSVIRVIYAPDT